MIPKSPFASKAANSNADRLKTLKRLYELRKSSKAAKGKLKSSKDVSHWHGAAPEDEMDGYKSKGKLNSLPPTAPQEIRPTRPSDPLPCVDDPEHCNPVKAMHVDDLDPADPATRIDEEREFKAMSWLNEGSGGALVDPVDFSAEPHWHERHCACDSDGCQCSKCKSIRQDEEVEDEVIGPNDGNDVDSTDGNVKACDLEWAKEISKKILEMDRRQKHLLTHLKVVQLTKDLASATDRAHGNYTPKFELDDDENKTRQELGTLARTRESFLRTLCNAYPEHPLCLAVDDGIDVIGGPTEESTRL